MTELDLSARTLSAGREKVGFDRLVLATGGRPVSLSGLGEGVEHHELRALADLRALHGAASDASSTSVIGSGSIGCERAVSLTRRGLDVTAITQEEAPRCERLGQ
ncbi:MAG: FAD/NAD(P)-binding oxidoreductase [Ornithinimicrobium sp.]